LVPWKLATTDARIQEISKGHKETLRPVPLPSGLKEIIFDSHVFERVFSKERFVDIGKSRPFAPQPLKLAMRNNDSNGLTSASQFDFGSRLGLIHDFRKI